MRSPRKVYAERIRSRSDERSRFTDMTARVRVYRRGPDGKARPAELLPDGYGGVWDSWSKCYRGPGKPVELKVHPGQVRLIEAFDDPSKRRVLALGSQGGGKTEGIITVAILLALWFPGKTGGVVAPVRGRIKVIWRKFLKVVQPLGWVQEIRPGDNEIVLKNGTLLQFFAAKRQSGSSGSPLAGNDWWWAVEDEQNDIDDESLLEVDARGRINADYRVFSSATNEARGYFQRRVKEYETNPSRHVVRFTGPDNSFTDLAYWDYLKANWDPETYRRKILAEDLPLDGRVYPAFSMRENVKPKPPPTLVGRRSDCTPAVTKGTWQGPAYDYVVGVDFGLRTCASVILQCYRAPGDTNEIPTDRHWWVIDEIVTEGKTPDWHAAALLKWFGNDPSKFIAVTGQDSNSTQPDKSDFVMFRQRGINITRASYAKRVYVEHRFAMVNALLHAADGSRRLFVDCDELGRVKAKKTVESLECLRLNASDRPETYGKGTKGGEDLTHYTDALGYALFPFESFRGTFSIPSDDHTAAQEAIRRRIENRWESPRY